MDIGFDGKVAIVTGAGGGLGRSHSLELARRGARVVVNDIGGAVDGTGGSDGPAQVVVKEIAELGGEAVADTSSVATPEGGAAIVQTALDAFGAIHVVVNNAGILRDKTIHKMEPEQLDSVLDVHLAGAFHVLIPAWSHMRDQAYGRVVNTTSNSGLLGNFGQSNYGAAKTGLVGMTNVLALEGAKYNIHVNAVAPIASTRMTVELFGEALSDRLDAEKVSPLVAWLCSEECTANGEIYSAGGGQISRFFIGLTKGVYDPQVSAESIRDSWDRIRDEDGYDVPANINDELDKLLTIFQENP